LREQARDFGCVGVGGGADEGQRRGRLAGTS